MLKNTLVFAALFLIGCEPVIDSRGYNPDNMNLSKIKNGKSTKDDVEEILGSPTLISNINISGRTHAVWYYISKKTSTTSFFKPQILEQKTMRIIFDKNDHVLKIEKLEKLKSVDLEPDPEQIKTTGYEENLGGSIWGTFDRMFNSSKKKKNDDA